MAIRELRLFEDEALRKKCREVTEVNDKIRMMLDDMMDTLHNTPNGAALAAPQVGILKRLVVIDLPEGTYNLVNPEIIEQSGEQLEPEGCLSFPDIWGKVKRPMYVKIKALNENGEPIELEGTGLMAKCFSHEIDHLDGICFVDKIEEYIK